MKVIVLEQVKLSFGNCVSCNRKKSWTVSDNTKQAKGLGKFVENLVKNSAKAVKIFARNVMRIPGKGLELGAKISSAEVSKSPKPASSTVSDFKEFYHKGKGLYLGSFVYIKSEIKRRSIKIDMSLTKFYPSAPIERNTDVEENLKEKTNDKNSINNSVFIIKDMIT